MIKEKAFSSYSRKISYNENLKTRKRRNEFPFPVDGSIGTKHRSILTLHFLHEVVENPNGSNDGCSRSFNAYRSGASPSFSSPLLSSFFYPLCSSRVSSLLPLWCAFLGGTIDVSIPWGKRAPRVVQSGLRRRVCVVQKWCGVVDWRGKFLLRSVKSMRFDPRDLT